MDFSTRHLANQIRLILLSFVALTAGCSFQPEQPPMIAKEPQYWPKPPDRPRFVHTLTLRDANQILAESEDDQMERILTGKKKPPITLGKPFAIAAQHGRLYITDTKINQVHVFDIARRKYFRLGFRLEGRLESPRGIALDAKQNIYVVDAGAERVVIYDSYGLYRRHIDLTDKLIKPTGIAVSPDGSNIYVVDTGGIDSTEHGVAAFDAEGNLLYRLGKRGADLGDFNLPVDAAVSPNGLLYVLDSGNFRVQVFDGQQVVQHWGEVGTSPGQFARPRSIDLDPAGNIYVSDAQFANIQIFSPQGQLLLPMGKRGIIDQDGVLTLVAGISIDESGRIYAIEQRHKKIEIYSPLTEQEGRRILSDYSAE